MLLRKFFSSRCLRARSFSGTTPCKGTEGPAWEIVRAVPFAVERAFADMDFDLRHGQDFFPPRKLEGVEEIFLPFWVANAKIRTTITQAKVGRVVHHTERDETTGVIGSRTELDWIPISSGLTYDRNYMAENPDMQVYASYRYSQYLVKRIIPTPRVTEARGFTVDMLDMAKHKTREIDSFTMRPTVALDIILDRVRKMEKENAVKFLKQHYQAEIVKSVQVDVAIETVRVSPVYLPAYVYTFKYLGTKFTGIVNGVDPRAGSFAFHNWKKVGGITAIGMGMIMLDMGMIDGMFWLGTLLPSLMTSLVALYLPIISMRLSDVSRRIMLKRHKPANDAFNRWDAPWIGAYEQFDLQQREREERRREELAEQRKLEQVRREALAEKLSQKKWAEQQRKLEQIRREASAEKLKQEKGTEQREERKREELAELQRRLEQARKEALAEKLRQEKAEAQKREKQAEEKREKQAEQRRVKREKHLKRNETFTDPKGYYRLLGVDKTATMTEVQAAFRGFVTSRSFFLLV
ncbi:hypothetical protein BC938DRAFT_482075 [Jimgerdemannia flammicorona]|uniref:Uncharacterized protein n=1 Tax=Jimgerdemannia flammicorona TaxID=994334 RepID=A0A433QER1_9FUNG|nr:hypothetical protein BC938DRAFT_482075 [Jimgerdemannia flammicorona]